MLRRHHGSGAGQALLDAVVGSEPCQLWVARENPRAHRFYRRNGFVPDGTERQDERAGGLWVLHWVRQQMPAVVEAMERCGNRRPRFERLASAWIQDVRGDSEPEGEADDPLIGASAEPRKRPRTRLMEGEVDAMRTALERGVSVNGVAKQCGVHRGTVWAKTRARAGKRR